MPQLKVVRIEDATARIKMIELAAPDGSVLPAFSAGAHIDLDVGNGEERSYSLLNDPHETHRYVLGVLRETEGRGGSAWIHDHWHQGTIVNASDPTNNFKLNEEGEHHILIAGGIGITPIVSMAARLSMLGRSYAVHYCARSEQEAAFFAHLKERHGTRLLPTFDAGKIENGLDVAALLKRRPPAAHVYVCGPAGLIRAVREAANDWPKGTVHYELFKGSDEDVALRSNDQPFDVVLQRSSAKVHVAADQTLLAALKAHGCRIKTMCTAGVCGTCRVGLISGKVDHRDDILNDDEREEVLQVCVSRAMPGETLVLDL